MVLLPVLHFQKVLVSDFQTETLEAFIPPTLHFQIIFVCVLFTAS
jgi:hypothetical protein